METKMKPIVSWTIWAGGLSLVMGIITRNQLLAGFRSDSTGMSYVIAALFIAGLIISFRAAKDLHNEWGLLKNITQTNQVPESASKGDLASVFNKLSNYKQKGETVDIHTVIDTYHAGHNSRVRSVSIMAALVISMGLLGTIVGLIMSISGLSGMVENIGLSRATMMEALKATIAGMGTAFYTTFFGALGGLVLRAVAVSQLNSLSELCAAATEYADAKLTIRAANQETELNQQVYKILGSFENMQREFDALTFRITESIEYSMKKYGESLADVGSRAMDTTEDCLAGVKEKMSGFSDDMGQAFGKVNQTIAEADQDIETSFKGLNVSITQASESVAGSLVDLKINIDENGSEVGGAVTELATAVNKATGQMETMASARLDTEASEIAGQLTLAADSIETYLKLKKGASKDAQKVA